MTITPAPRCTLFGVSTLTKLTQGVCSTGILVKDARCPLFGVSTPLKLTTRGARYLEFYSNKIFDSLFEYFVVYPSLASRDLLTRSSPLPFYHTLLYWSPSVQTYSGQPTVSIVAVQAVQTYSGQPTVRIVAVQAVQTYSGQPTVRTVAVQAVQTYSGQPTVRIVAVQAVQTYLQYVQ